MIFTKENIIYPVINREPHFGFYCESGLITEVIDENYAEVSFGGYSAYSFHRDELMTQAELDKSFTPSEYSFKTIMTALKCGTLKPLGE